MIAPEFSVSVRIDTLGDRPRDIALSADATARERLAARFGLVAIDRLDAQAAVRREGDAVIAEGRVQATVVQSCIATGDPLPAEVAADFALRFVPDTGVQGDEIELSEADLDTIPYAGGAIDLGETVAEELSLALDPFPRSAGADAALREAGVIREDEVRPTSALAQALKDKLK